MSLRNRLSGARRLFERAFNQEELDLTEGGIGRPLFVLAIPIVITNLFQTAYNLADTFWVGRYSTEALAAISFAFPMVFLLISLGMGLSVAGSVIIAQNIGAGDEREADYAASQTISFAVVTSIVLGTVGYFVVETLVQIYGASPDVKPLAVNYMEVISLGLVFMFGFIMFISLMRGAGDTVTPMIVMGISVVINIVLDPFFIFGFQNNPLFAMVGMPGLQEQLFTMTGYTGDGLRGAAVATVLSRAVAFLIGLWIMYRGNQGVQIRLGDMGPDLDFARRILDIGVPASVEGVGRALSVNLLLIVVGLFATPVVSAYGIGTRVLSVVFMPAIAMARGVETMSGQNIGADKPDRAAATAAFASKASFLILSAVGVIAFVWAEPIVSIFVGGDQTNAQRVIEVGAQFMRFVAPTFGFMGIMRAYNGSFRGAGKTTTAAIISVGTLMVFRLPIAWLGSETLSLGPNGLWLSFALSNVFGATVAYLWYQRGTWRNASLDRTPGPTPSDD
ncbi:MATE family efflux transporter [Haladaptatus caseinilyticus]|uniref:MATE family efflux transporter n=1 Tax=Haladaptatus caseinilyticus TaxID=2993314 RepID=UPI00224B3A6D|nr:MATE family efflux transporter [Haladaptatus caseinilyticus]